MSGFEDFMGQSAHIAQLRRDFSAHAFVHAYLLSGPKGTGKKSIARLCAMAAVCRGVKKPCGECGPCRRILSDSHPDLHTVLPEKGKQGIGVDVMRELLAEVGVKSFEDGTKALIFPEAERMTVQAQNCLLKTLEEPPQNTVFFLITDQPASLLPTIVSRCRVVRFHPLDPVSCEKRLIALGETPQAARQKARMAEGCVGQALAIDDEALQMRKTLTQQVFSVRGMGDIPALSAAYKDDKERGRKALDTLEAAVRDIVIAQAGGVSIADAGYAGEAERYARTVPLTGGLALQETILQARKMLGSNVSFASSFESILLKIAEEYTRWPW